MLCATHSLHSVRRLVCCKLLQWTSNITPIQFITLNSVALTMTQGGGAVSDCSNLITACCMHGTNLGFCVTLRPFATTSITVRGMPATLQVGAVTPACSSQTVVNRMYSSNFGVGVASLRQAGRRGGQRAADTCCWINQDAIEAFCLGEHPQLKHPGHCC